MGHTKPVDAETSEPETATRTESGDTASISTITTTVRAAAADPKVKTLEKQKKRVTLSEAMEFLRSTFDLQAALKEADTDHFLWGITPHLTEKGVINAYQKDEYAKLFDKATIDHQDLVKVKQIIESGEEMDVVFDSGKLSIEELCKIIYKQNGIEVNMQKKGVDWHFRSNSSLDSLIESRRIKLAPDIDATTIYRAEGFAGLHKRLVDAYKSASPTLPSGPRILFVPNNIAEKSPWNAIELESQGKQKFLDPRAGLLLFRKQIDREYVKVHGQPNIHQPAQAYLMEFAKWSESIHNDAMSGSHTKLPIEEDHVPCFPTYVNNYGEVPRFSFLTSSRNYTKCFLDIGNYGVFVLRNFEGTYCPIAYG